LAIRYPFFIIPGPGNAVKIIEKHDDLMMTFFFVHPYQHNKLINNAPYIMRAPANVKHKPPYPSPYPNPLAEGLLVFSLLISTPLFGLFLNHYLFFTTHRDPIWTYLLPIPLRL